VFAEYSPEDRVSADDAIRRAREAARAGDETHETATA